MKNKHNKQFIDALATGQTVERLCYTTYEGKQVYAKVIFSEFKDPTDQYRIL